MGRDDSERGHYIRSARGFKNAQLSYQLNKKIERLGHFKNSNPMDWDKQLPRDNKMYYIGEGRFNLKQMDKHLKTKDGSNINIFSSRVLNDDYLQNQK